MPNSSLANPVDNNLRPKEFCAQLKRCEKQWWRARQRIVALRQRQTFWYKENSLFIWLLWQFVSYVVVAILIMLICKIMNTQLPLWQYIAIFSVQTLFFLVVLSLKDRLADHLQKRINTVDMLREQAFSEMLILAKDSIFPDIHANSPISLQQIYERYEGQLHISSLQRLLKKEVDAGRLSLTQRQTVSSLPPELAENELLSFASKMVYRSRV